MERKSSKEYSVVFLVEGENVKLRNLPSRTSSLLCSAAKQKQFVNRKVVSHNCNKRKIETNLCEELTSELLTELER